MEGALLSPAWILSGSLRPANLRANLVTPDKCPSSQSKHGSLVAVVHPVPCGTGLATSFAMPELYIYLRLPGNGIFRIRENSSIYSSNFRPGAGSRGCYTFF